MGEEIFFFQALAMEKHPRAQDHDVWAGPVCLTFIGWSRQVTGWGMFYNQGKSSQPAEQEMFIYVSSFRWHKQF